MSAGLASRIFAPVTVELEERSDGITIIRSGRELEGELVPVGQRLLFWAMATPDEVFLRERDGSSWRSLTYLEAWNRARQTATGLLRAGCSSDQPLMILAGNSIDHAIFMLAGMLVGIPVAPVSVAYASYGSYDRLKLLADVSRATAAFIGPEIPAEARHAVESWDISTILSTAFDEIETDEILVDSLAASVTLDSVAKLMFTSGSTGTPKAVINTHRMIAANQLQLAAVWPILREKPPAFVDWLPWSHTFGGNFVFNLALWNGGSLAIDTGRPAPALIGKTLEAISDIGPTIYFSVPAGYEALIPALRANPELARKALRNLDFVFCAAAALPEVARRQLGELLREFSGRRIPIVSGWGSTETAPCATVVHFEDEYPGNIGVPLPGVTIKMVPANGKHELLVKGPNVTPGYWRMPEATAAAFDEAGYYRIGDAGKLVDPARPSAGLAFDGRIAENFKLLSGTWVNVGALRVAIIDACRPFVQDAVITGHDRDEIGALLFPNTAACSGFEDATELADSNSFRAALNRALNTHNAKAGGSSMRVMRFAVEMRPPAVESGELTDKGYINQRAVLQNRAATVMALYADHRSKVEEG